MRTRYSATVFALFLLVTIAAVSGRAVLAANEDFFVLPYLQMGNNPRLAAKESEEIVWLSRDDHASWKVEIKRENEEAWDSSGITMHKKELLNADAPLFMIWAEVHELPPGKLFDYRVLKNGASVFTSWTRARKSVDEPFTFAIFGDAAAGSEGQRNVAFECYKAKPDLVIIPGDIVYDSGRLSEYLQKFFPVYNYDDPAASKGAPLLRSTMFVGALGNHDIGRKFGYPINLDPMPDGMAYYELWRQPLNGPSKAEDGTSVPLLSGDKEVVRRFLKSAGDAFPTMSNFSFDYGSSHWLVLDGNPYMNWSDSKLRDWVENDLKQTKRQWKFVTFHQPGFSCDTEHAHEQRMRLLSDIFDRTNVDVVFAGHAHNYQRTFPLKFEPKFENGIPLMKQDGTVPGTLTLDKKYDGTDDKRPHGVIYIVTGGGGAKLYHMRTDCTELETGGINFVARAVSDVHSLTICHVDQNELTIQQVSASGKALDSFAITKNNPNLLESHTEDK